MANTPTLAAEELLAAARRVFQAEQAWRNAKAEYESLFERIVRTNTVRAPSTVRASLNAIINGETGATAATSTPPGGTESVKAEEQVYLYVVQQSSPQDARSVSEATGIIEPTVRWAFSKLSEKQMLRRTERGYYEAKLEKKTGSR